MEATCILRTNLPKTNIFAEHGWLEGSFQGRSVNFREANCPHSETTKPSGPVQVPRSSFLAIQAMHTMVIASGPHPRVAILNLARKTNEGNVFGMKSSFRMAGGNSRNQHLSA